MAVVKVITSASIDLRRGVNVDKSSKNARESCQRPTLTAANDDSQGAKKN